MTQAAKDQSTSKGTIDQYKAAPSVEGQAGVLIEHMSRQKSLLCLEVDITFSDTPMEEKQWVPERHKK